MANSLSTGDQDRAAGNAISEVPTPPQIGRIASLEGLRAYAVVLVFLVHFFGQYYASFRGVKFDEFDPRAAEFVDWIGYYFWASHYGVDLFFLLSGFLIFRIVSRTDFRYLAFLRNRFVRLYPAFLAAVLLQLAYATYFWHQSFDATTIVANLLFLHGFWELKIAPILVPTWTLSFEWLFYLLFPLLALALARGREITLRHIAICALPFLAIGMPMGQHYVRFLMFFVGAALACLPAGSLQRLGSTLKDGTVLAGAIAVNMLFVVEQNFYHFIWPYAAASFLLTVRVIHGNGVLNRTFSWAPLRKLGNLSYSFYLLHGLAVIIVVDHLGPVLSWLPGALRFAVLMAVAFLMALVAAKVSYALFERPYFDRKLRGAQSAAAAHVTPPIVEASNAKSAA